MPLLSLHLFRSLWQVWHPRRVFSTVVNLHFSSCARPLAVAHHSFQKRAVENMWEDDNAISGADAVLEIQYPHMGC